MLTYWYDININSGKNCYENIVIGILAHVDAVDDIGGKFVVKAAVSKLAELIKDAF